MSDRGVSKLKDSYIIILNQNILTKFVFVKKSADRGYTINYVA